MKGYVNKTILESLNKQENQFRGAELFSIFTITVLKYLMIIVNILLVGPSNQNHFFMSLIRLSYIYLVYNRY